MQFGIGNHKLYGVYHPPLTQNLNQKSILLCSSIGPEYARPYRLLRLLAEHLAENGHHVFRFDWYGCGDSWGESHDGNVENWIFDVSLASEELINISGNQLFSLIGLRFGATIAWLSLSDSINLQSLILWEPVVNGADWSKEMEFLHASYLKTSPKMGRSLCNEEILGYPFSKSLKQEICSITLLNSKVPKCNSLHVIYSGKSDRYDSLKSHCNFAKSPISFQFIDTPDIWTNSVFSPLIILSNPSIQTILTYFDQRTI